MYCSQSNQYFFCPSYSPFVLLLLLFPFNPFIISFLVSLLSFLSLLFLYYILDFSLQCPLQNPEEEEETSSEWQLCTCLLTYYLINHLLAYLHTYSFRYLFMSSHTHQPAASQRQSQQTVLFWTDISLGSTQSLGSSCTSVRCLY
jgi:hypothetical protein